MPSFGSQNSGSPGFAWAMIAGAIKKANPLIIVNFIVADMRTFTPCPFLSSRFESIGERVRRSPGQLLWALADGLRSRSVDNGSPGPELQLKIAHNSIT